MKISKGKLTFDLFNYLFLTLFCLTIILPFMYIISVSLSSKDAIESMSVGLIPKGIDLRAYQSIIQQKLFTRSMVNTVFLTTVSTIVGVLVNIMAAYSLSKKFYGKKVVSYIFVVSMYFSGGLIPTYMLVAKYLGLYNSYWALFLPGIVNVFYMIVMRTQIEAIPPSLTEAALIDGANESQILFRIILPSVTATIAAISMFIALASWNMWFNVMIYTNKRELWTLQYYLRSVIFDKVISQQLGDESLLANSSSELTPQNFQNAAIILVALPVIMVYPFIQKYFVKGMMVGSVKE